MTVSKMAGNPEDDVCTRHIYEIRKRVGGRGRAGFQFAWECPADSGNVYRLITTDRDI
jgi:hypothetical protein